jgi:multiple sugar transport system permease protein
MTSSTALPTQRPAALPVSPLTPLTARMRRLVSFLLVHAVLLAGAVFMLLPFVFMLVSSIKPPRCSCCCPSCSCW